MTRESFDLVIIGAGPGGFDAALRARELGWTAALVEKADPGGTCLNTGCIPTKTLLASTKLLTKITEARSYGLSVSGVSADQALLLERKNRVVETLKKGMTESLQRAGVEWIQGEARFLSKNRLAVQRDSSSRELEARSILIATGAEPMPFPAVPFDGETVHSSTTILELKVIPKHLLIIGGGIVGVEFASIFRPLGTHVTIVEMLDRLISGEEEEVGRRLESLFRRKGMEVYTGEKVRALTREKQGIRASLESGKTLEADQVLVAAGRRPRTEQLDLSKAGVRVEKGAIGVNEYLETSTPGIFAIGDVTSRTTGLAHGASAEGIRVVENLRGPKVKMDYHVIPNCIYTDPEIASVGNYRTGNAGAQFVECKVLFSSLGKSHIEGETEGFVKMAASKKEGRLLGVTGIGGRITELIHEAALALQAGLKVEILAEMVHAHPTESEVFQRAAREIVRSLREK